MLQGVAYANMIREYSEVVPFTQAVKMTLSGEYPCAMCKAIADKKQSENSKIFSFDKNQKKFSPQVFCLVKPARDVSPVDFLVYTESFQTRAEAPPTPPPRNA